MSPSHTSSHEPRPTSELACHSERRIENRQIVYDLVHERRGSGGHPWNQKSKTSTLARCRGPFSRFNPPSGARRDSDFSCRSRTPSGVCSSGLNIAGPRALSRWRYLSMRCCAPSSPTTISISEYLSGSTTFPRNSIMFGQPQSTSFHPESPSGPEHPQGGPLKNNRTRDQTRLINDRVLSLCGRVESRRIESLLKCARA